MIRNHKYSTQATAADNNQIAVPNNFTSPEKTNLETIVDPATVSTTKAIDAAASSE